MKEEEREVERSKSEGERLFFLLLLDGSKTNNNDR
jgi:hypothetical protein